MIHGDLKGVRLRRSEPAILPSSYVQANVLIDQNRHARLADFGLLTIASDPKNCLSSSSHTQGGTARWMSPELINPRQFGLDKSRPTKPSDCYALGMVIYETISGHSPFHKDIDLTVFVKVLNGEHPSREPAFTDSLWKILEWCWEPRPDARPTIGDVLQRLEIEVEIEIPPRVLDAEIDDDDDWSSANNSPGKFFHFVASTEFRGLCPYVNTEIPEFTLALEGDNSVNQEVRDMSMFEA